MKKLILLLLIISINACKNPEKLRTSTYKGSEILVGKAKKKDFEKAPYKKWFVENFNDYQPNTKTISRLKKVINNYKITVVMGTWCGDSREQVPKLYKILEQTGYNNHNLDMFCVYRKYKYYKPVQKYNIIRVPTIIVYQNGKEKGRIIEYPMQSIEADLLKIMTTDNYLHELNDYSKTN
jgi:thiol-disulfide isomerase/thioredoxin